jgi:type I restriction enzyme, S subunit
MELGLIEAALDDVCALVTDGTHDTPRRVSSGFPLIKAKEIVSGQIDFSVCDQISESDHLKVIARSKPEFGDTLFTHIGASLGAAAFVSTHREFSIKNIALFKPDRSIIDSRYLYYLVISPDFQSLAIGTKTGSAQPFLGLSQLRSHRIQYHRSLAVQRRIGSILSAYDDLIENSQRRIKILEEMARRLYREWFVDFRFPGHEDCRLVESPLGEIPEGWEVRKLRDVCRLTMGQSPKSETYNEVGNGMAFHQGVSDFGNRYPTDRLFCNADGRMAEAGDILFSVRAPVGRMNIANKPIILGRGLSAIRHLQDFQAFLWEQLLNSFTKIDMIGNGAIFASVTKEDMQGIDLLCPPYPLIVAATNYVEPFHSEIATLSQQIQNLRRTRDLLLPRLLSGQIDVEALPEPALMEP